MASQSLSPSDKAAILLVMLGEALAAEILPRLEPHERSRILAAMARLRHIDAGTALGVMEEFKQLSARTPAIDARSKAKAILGTALPKAEAEALWSKHGFDAQHEFAFLNGADAALLADVLAKEHPQTAALVTALMGAKQASEVLRRFPPALQTDLMARIARLEDVDPDVLSDLSDVLREKMQQQQARHGRTKLGGMESASAILNAMGTQDSDVVLSSVEQRDPGLAEALRRGMFTFKDLLRVDVRGMMELIKETPRQELIHALRGAKEAEMQHFLAAMSERAGKILQDDVKARGPVKISDVRAAQQRVAERAQALVEQGKANLTDLEEAV